MTDVIAHLPGGLAEVDPVWLTRTLRDAGAIGGDTTVVSFESEPAGAGAGMMGQVVRLSPTYERPIGGEPTSVVAKFPAAAQANRDFANLLHFYEREVRFYQQVAAGVELRTPRTYCALYDPATNSFVLLMEDLGEPGDQVSGCPPDRAFDVLEQIGSFHRRLVG